MATCRKEKGMTQVQLAEKLGVTAKTISRWENGNYMPDLSMLQPISEELGISLNELLNGERLPKEELQTEELLEKTEYSLTKTLQYAAMQIKQRKKKLFQIVSLLLGGFVLVLFLLHHFLFSEIPYREGDVSQWEILFPKHSAYELAMGEIGKPVFVDTDAALKKVKMDCSDAIKVIKQVYNLQELSKYNYKKYHYYAGLSSLLFRDNERIMEQRRLLINSLDILGNSYAWDELRELDKETNDGSVEALESTLVEDETDIRVIDNANADCEVITYEKEIDMTADGVADRIIFVINVTEEFRDLTDTYEILSMPFIGRVKLYDGVSEELIWESRNISHDRIGNHQISLVTKDDSNYLMAGETQEQMGDGYYYYRVFSFEGWKPEINKGDSDSTQYDNNGRISGEWLVDGLQIVDTYQISFVLEDEAQRLFPNMLLRAEAVPDYREHIEKWFKDSELIVATDIMMERPNDILYSTTENKVWAETYYNLVWERLSDQTAAFEFVCPEISFPTEKEWIQDLISIAVDEQVAVAKYYDALAGGYCVLKAGACTEDGLLENIEYANYLFPGNVLEQHLSVENSTGEHIDISQCEIPFENGEYKKEVQTYWVYNGKTYVIFADVARDADISSIMEMAKYMASRM